MKAQPLSLQRPTPPQYEPNTDKLKKNLLRHGVVPTPKILRNLRKKEIQKHNRKLSKTQSESLDPPLTQSQQETLAQEQHFQTLRREYKDFSKAVLEKTGKKLIGKPWERIERLKFRELASESKEFGGENLKRENLRELKQMFEKDMNWVIDDDIEVENDGYWSLESETRDWDPAKRWRNEAEAIRVLVNRLSEREMTVKNWKFVRIMKQSGLQFSEGQLLKILRGLGDKGSWKQAISVLEWVYGHKERRDLKSRFVYTKLLAVLGKARRPHEALHIFKLMLGDCSIYPDIAAYHSVAVTLGQAGLLKELVKLIECMRQKPSKRIKNMRSRNWDPVMEPDLVIYNAVLNACVPSRQWKGVHWVFKQLRKSGLRPNGATYGLAMEVMLKSGKYDFVHEFFAKMEKSGEAPRALTYKVLVRAFWEEGKISKAVRAVKSMEQKGVVGTASVYYELACCLCNNGSWRDAMRVVEKMKNLRNRKPLEVTFTGLITSSLEGGHIESCISIFHHMKDHCEPNIGTINTMLKVYGQSDMFSQAKQLFEETFRDDTSFKPDIFTYSSMLEASASAQQWEYFEYVYKGMAFSGYQLDQTKHAWLLVEASRAGKTYLIEHAFETLLETGEIPHPLLFTEMLIQAIVQGDYEKVITLVNTMAYAPFQVSERQWVELFVENKERINRGSLEQLSNALSNCDVASEITVSNLSKSLDVLCGNQAVEMSLLNYGDQGVCVNGRENTQSYSKSMLVENIDNGESLARGTDLAGESIPFIGSEYFVDDDHEDDNVKGYSEDMYEDREEEAETAIQKLDGFDGSKLPSADEILRLWKESRNKDGMFLPFQLGKN